MFNALLLIAGHHMFCFILGDTIEAIKIPNVMIAKVASHIV